VETVSSLGLLWILEGLVGWLLERLNLEGLRNNST
jgi:hypothetical protein